MRRPKRAAMAMRIMRPMIINVLAFTGGFVIMALELLGGRILAPYFGSSIYVWGSIMMNEGELAKNPRLTDHVVHDLNREPELPYDDASFDAVVNAVSIQYLTKPVQVFRSVTRVLRPGGLHVVAMSHRCFPTKAVRAWHVLAPRERLETVRTYFVRAKGYDEPELLDRSPPGADPLWIVVARRRD